MGRRLTGSPDTGRVATFLVSVMLAGIACGGPTSTQSPSPTMPAQSSPPAATMNASPTGVAPTPTQSEPVQPTDSPGPPGTTPRPDSLEIEAFIHETRFVTEDQWLVDSYGSTLGYRQRVGRNWQIELVDPVSGETNVVPGSRTDAALIVQLDETSVIFLVNDYGRLPGGRKQVNSWQIQRYDRERDSLAMIATGINTRITDDVDIHWPYVVVDGDLIAYDEERSGPGMPARIVVRAIPTGEVTRMIDVDRPVFGIELDGANVTYVTGDVSDPGWSGPDNEQRIYSPVEGPDEVLPLDEEGWDFAENGVSVTVDDGQADPDGVRRSTIQFSGPNGRSEIVTTGTRAVGHGDGLIVWQSEYGYERALTVYDTRTGLIGLLDADGPDEWHVDGMVGISDGWVVWTRADGTYTRAGYTRTVIAVRTSDVAEAFEELAAL